MLDEVAAWHSRPLKAVYPVVFFDALRVKIRDESVVRNKAVHIALAAFAESSWGRKYVAIVQSWERAWEEVIPFYAFPAEVRKLIYTSNAIEELNARLRRAVRARGHFPNDDAALKLLFLALNRAEKEWIMPPREWSMAKAQFAILFGEHFVRATV